MDTTSEKGSETPGAGAARKLLKPVNIALIAVAVSSLVLSLVFTEKGAKFGKELGSLALELALLVPAILVMIGLFAEFVGDDFVVKYLGDKAGIKGFLASFMFPLLIPVPLMMELPMGNILYGKNARLAFIYSFFGASAFSIIGLLFEAQFMGPRWMAIRLMVSIPVVIILCFTAEFFYYHVKFGKPVPSSPGSGEKQALSGTTSYPTKSSP